MVKRSIQDDAPYPAATDRCALAWEVLCGVADPEIPVLNIVDLGIIADVRIEDEQVIVDVTPTFAGCPALDVIRENIRQALVRSGERNVVVNTVYDPPWTSERLSETGRKRLKEFGLAPPVRCCDGGATPNLQNVPCPLCDSINTEIESLFGPTLCRSIHYCNDCLQSFEHFKTV